MVCSTQLGHGIVGDCVVIWIGVFQVHDTWQKLQLGKLLPKLGWGVDEIQLACTQVISRAAYIASELETTRWIKDNSAVCTLNGYEKQLVT